MVQISRFNDGSFVVHKILGCISAWYDSQGNLKDAEKFDSLGRSRKPAKGDYPIIESVGKVYRRVTEE